MLDFFNLAPQGALATPSSVGSYRVTTRQGVLPSGQEWRAFIPLGAAGKRGIVATHGAFTDETQLTEAAVYLDVLGGLVEAGHPVIMGDLGGTSWGNDTARTKMDELVAFFRQTLGASSDPVSIFAVSMGGADAMSWAAVNIEEVHSVAMIAPALSIQTVWDEDVLSELLALRQSINTAYGSQAGWEAARATHDPGILADTGVYSGLPMKIWYMQNDGIINPQTIVDFAEATGAATQTIPGLHFLPTVPVADITEWLLNPPFSFVDDFERPNGPVKNGWTDLASIHPDDFNPCAVHNGAFVCGDPYSRPPFEDTPGKSEGIGGMFRETGITNGSVTVLYAGDQNGKDSDGNAVPHAIECAAAMHFKPDTTRTCIGIWPSRLGDLGGAVFIGYLGRPPDEPQLGTGGQFEIFGLAAYSHDHNPHYYTITSEDGAVTGVYRDGKRLQMVSFDINDPDASEPVDVLPFDPELADSTMHGVTYDIHYMDPPDTTTPVANYIRISGISS